MDPQYQDQLAKLLKFETSIGLEGDLITLDEYISRCPPEQKTIYYLIAPDRKSAFASPYYETFKKHNKEVSAPFSVGKYQAFFTLIIEFVVVALVGSVYVQLYRRFCDVESQKLLRKGPQVG